MARSRWPDAGLALVLMVAALILGAPRAARADPGDLTPGGYFVCDQDYVGVRYGGIGASSLVDAVGVVTAVSVSPISDAVSFVNTPTVGQQVHYGESINTGFHATAGPTSVSFTLAIHWDDVGGTGPRDATATETLDLNPCDEHPIVTATQLSNDCSGPVLVLVSNGTPADVSDVGGSFEAEVYGAGGWHAGPEGIRAQVSPVQFTLPVDAASSYTVLADGTQIFHGGYIPGPMCDPGSGTSNPPTGSGSSSGGGGGGDSSGGAPIAVGATSSRPAPTTSGTSAPALPAPGPSAAAAASAAAAVETARASSVMTTAVVGVSVALVVVLGVAAGLVIWRRRGTGP